MPKFLPTGGFKWSDPKEYDLNKLPAIVQKDAILKLILNIQKNYVNYIMFII